MEEKLVLKERFRQYKEEYTDLQKRLFAINQNLYNSDVSYSKRKEFLAVSSKLNELSNKMEDLLRQLN